MGEAKRRGNREQRIASARLRLADLRPKHIICDDCGAKLTNIDHLPMPNDPHAEALFAAKCESCDSVTPYPCYTAAGQALVQRWVEKEKLEGSNEHLLHPKSLTDNL